MLVGELGQFFFEGVRQRKLGHLSVGADEVSVFSVAFQRQLEHMPPLPQIAALEDAGLFKLSQHLVDRRQAEWLLLFKQEPVHIVSAEVAYQACFEHIKHLQAWKRASQHGYF